MLFRSATAALSGRDYVSPDDVQEMALPALRHRIVLQPEAEANGLTSDEALRTLFQQVPVPR